MKTQTKGVSEKDLPAIRFYIARQSGVSAIVLTVRMGKSGNRGLEIPSTMKVFRITTGISVPAESWDTKSGRVKRNYENFAVTNRSLERIQTETENHFRNYLMSDRELFTDSSCDELRATVRSITKPEQAQHRIQINGRSLSLLDCFEKFIEVRADRDTVNTIKGYRTVFNHMTRFLQKRKRLAVFEMVDETFEDQYIHYLLNDANLTDNSVAKQLKVTKTFLKWAEQRGYHSNRKYIHLFKKSKFEREATTVALNESELSSIENLDLSTNARLSNVRDLFLIGVYTGLRFSDITKLKPTSFSGEYIRIHIQKTRTAQSIPIIPRLRLVLDRYPDFVFPKISAQKTNQYLKELCAMAGIDSEIEITRYSGGEPTTTTVPKYQVISSHTARRSFVTLALKLGMRAEVVKAISGHRDHKTFERYVRLDDADLREEMNNAWK